MNLNNNIIHPYVRIIFLILSLIAVLLIGNIYYLLGFYILFLLPVRLSLNLINIHLRLILLGIIPIFLTFILLYIIILKEVNGGWDFIFLKCLKILCFTSVFQIFLSIPPNMLLTTFKKWGFRGDNLLTLIGAFTVWADIKTRSNQIVIARFARGFVGNRTIFNTAKQFPYVLVPLIIGVLRTSIERVEVWEQRNIPDLVDSTELRQIQYNSFFNFLMIIIPVGFILLAVYLKYFY